MSTTAARVGPGRANSLRAAVEARTGPFGAFAKRVLTGAGIAALVSLVAVTLGMILFDATNPSSWNLVQNFGLLMVIGVVAGNVMPVHVALSGTIGSYQGEFLDLATRAPINLLTTFVVISAAYGGFLGARKGGTSWPAGLGVAFVYATITTLLALILQQYGQSSALDQGVLSSAGFGNIRAVFVNISPDVFSAWLYCFGLVLIPAIIGAAIRGSDLSALATRRSWDLWYAPLVGTLVSIVIALFFTFAISFIWFLAGLSSIGGFPLSDQVRSFMVFLDIWFGPLMSVLFLNLGVGSSIKGVTNSPLSSPYQLDPHTHQFSWGLLVNWPFDQALYLLPVIPLVACVLGAFVTLRLSKRYSSAFTMAIPFALASLLFSFLAVISINFSPAANVIAGDVSLKTLANDTIGSSFHAGAVMLSRNLDLHVGLTPDLLVATVGALIIALIGACIASLLYLVWSYLAGMGPVGQDMPLVSHGNPPPTNPFPGVQPANPRGGPRPRERQTASEGFEIPPAPRSASDEVPLVDHYEGPGRPAARPVTGSRSVDPGGRPLRGGPPIELAANSVAVSKKPPRSRKICPQCGKISINESQCPACSAPLDR